MSLIFMVLVTTTGTPLVAVDDRTAAEFRKYAAEKLSGLSDAKLDAIVQRVDVNGDGTISDDEFAERLSVFRDIKKGPEPWREKLEDARAFAKKTGRPLLIYARADWCAPCLMFEKKTIVAEDVQMALSAFVLLRLDIDKQKDAAEGLGIRAIPVMIVEDSAGNVIDKAMGSQPPDKLLPWLAKTAAEVGSDRKRTLRVLSYNIHHGAGVDGKLDLERIAKVILSAKPDIVALQEVDRKAARTKDVDQAKELARLTKMKFVFGPNIKLGDGDYGNAVLSRFPLKLRKNHKLPNIDKGEQRGVLDVDIQTPGGPVRMLATHFDHRRPEEERMASAEFVNKLFKQEPKLPTLLAGDLNATPTSRPLRKLSSRWKLANEIVQGKLPTVPVKEPGRQIDFVLSAPANRTKVIETKVLPEAVASDHRAILAIVELLPQAEK